MSVVRTGVAVGSSVNCQFDFTWSGFTWMTTVHSDFLYLAHGYTHKAGFGPADFDLAAASDGPCTSLSAS